MRVRKQAKVNQFIGVDFSTPLASVNPNRAIDILNFIRKDGVTQKRKPWEQIASVPSVTYYTKENINNIETWVAYPNSKRINGMWSFIGEDGKPHIVAHIGSLLFLVRGIGKDFSFKDANFMPLTEQVEENGQVYNLAMPILDEKVKAACSGNRLYIMGGKKILMLRYYVEDNYEKWELVELEDSKYTYIPVTTTGITYTDSPTPSRMILDAVNLLSSFRRNKCISGTLYEGNNVIRTTRFYEYKLDSDMEYDDGFEIKLNYMEARA